MKTLITGGAGFIGSHLADLLVSQGGQVILLDDLSTGSYDNIEHLLGRRDVEFVLGSILNADLLDGLVARSDRIFHLAAAVGVQLIVNKPLESLQTNIRGSELVLEKAHKYSKPILVTSTSEIYGKNTSDLLGEEDDRILGSPLKSRWSYSEGKAIEEILAYTYWREKGLPTFIVRLFNTVGPRQTGQYGMVIPRFISQAVRDESLTVYGDGRQTRCFCHVTDVVETLVRVIESPQAQGKVFNVGGTEEVNMADLAALVIERAKSSSSIRFIPYDEAYEEGFEDMQRRVPDTSRIREAIGFDPQHDLHAIIDDVIAEQRR
ncbi:MAG: GDP-mannose 4,6-dehydratase [Dehalococcoidia bacterium]